MKNKVRDLRRKRGWTQAQLATHLDVSRQTLNAIERGRHEPRLPLAFKLAEAFDTSVEAVFRP